MMRARTLATALLRRELSRAWLVLLLAGVCSCVWAARSAALAPADPASAPSPLRILQRFDLWVLGVACVLTALRMAQRAADDHRDAWFDAYAAAGGPRRYYGPLLCAAVLTSHFILYAAAASAFAFAVARFAGTPELVRALPVTLATGFLVMAGIAAYAGWFAIAVHEALSALLAALALLAAPTLAVFAHFQRSGTSEIPLLLRAWLVSYPPAIQTATTLRVAAWQLAYAICAIGVLALLSHRFTGRRA